jgi:hypothetical protein
MRATTSGSAGAEGDTSPLMPHTTGKRYAVASCHVERPLDDEVWSRFSALQQRRPGGFAIAALMRPPDVAAGEDEARWVERAREAAARGPLGHHTHWTAPDHARPTGDGSGAGARVLAEGRRLRELGLEPTLFCGGGWYTDEEVAEACAELGYVDCTPRASRPTYLAAGERWASLAEPARVRLSPNSVVRSIPTTHSVGELARALVRWPRRAKMPRRVTERDTSDLPRVVHVYFHDTDLLRRKHRSLLAVLLPALSRLSAATDLDDLATSLDAAPEIAWTDVARL